MERLQPRGNADIARQVDAVFSHDIVVDAVIANPRNEVDSLMKGLKF